MDIRSVTLFCEPDFAPDSAREFLAAAREAFLTPVQTTRVATTPFPKWLPVDNPVPAAARFAERWRGVGVDFISLGAVLRGHDASWIDVIPELVALDVGLFANVEIADREGGIDFGRIRHTATLIHQLATIHANGFGNLYVTAIANCPPGSPYFPVAYNGGGTGFALAVESADLALAAIETAKTLDEARQNIITAVETAARQLSTAAEQLAAEHNIEFRGIDFSFSPFPEPEKSLGGALEALGIGGVGSPGSLFAAAFLTDALQRADFPKCGFNGLMLPVLEDSVLAERAANGQLDVQTLLGYSAVCGVGLDTVPLAGDVSAETLQAILLDVAAMATRLNKPLTARLMPIPGLNAGDPVKFDFPYFADSRAMPASGTLSGFLAKADTIHLNQIHAAR